MGRKRYREQLVVDGYNIINYWPSLKDASINSLEEAREKLMDILAEYAHYAKLDIMVVFDAYKVNGRIATEEKYHDITVVFTEEYQTADHYIEKYLDRYGMERRIRVATSDRVEQDLILSRGGTRVSARELEAEIQDSLRNAKRKQALVNTKNDYVMGEMPSKFQDMLEKWNNLQK